MQLRPILSKSISSLVAVGTMAAGAQLARAATYTWDGGGTGDTNLGTALNWSGDTLPSVSVPDTMQWDGTVAGPLSLVYSDSSFAGAAPNPGVNLNITGTQVGSLNIDSGANPASFRMNTLTIAAGAGAFSLGNGTGTFNLTLGGGAGTQSWTNDSSNTATVASDVVMGLGGGGAHTLALAGAGNWTLNNVLTNSSGTLSLTKTGAGTLTLAGVNTYTGQTTISGPTNLTGSIATSLVNITAAGTLNLAAGGAVNPTNATSTTAQFNVGSTAGGNAILNLTGGTLNASKSASPSFVVASAANSSGFVKMSSGTLTTASQLNLGNGAGAAGTNPYAAFSMTGGTVTSGSWLVIGANNDRAVLNQSGGSITVAANRMTIGAGGNGSVGVVNLSGGTFTDNGGIFVGENGVGILNVSGSASMNLGPTGQLAFGNNASSIAGTVNLLGGTISANNIAKATAGTGVYRFNFNGGTLKPTASNGTFFASQANTQAYVYSGGANFDTSGFDVTVGQPLLAPAGNGLSAVAVTSGGAGYIDTPVVTVSGGTGIGAQAVANVSGGVVTGFTITNPGSGYTAGDVLTVSLFGGGASTAATVGAVTLGSNVSGGLTKNGAGTLTLTGANTYTGNIAVNAGTLAAGAGNIGNPVTSALGNNTVAGRTVTVAPGAKLNLTSNDIFGNATAVVANLPALLINGTLNTNRYNQVGAITLNGATLSSSNTTDSGNYQNFQFLGDITVAGTAPSFIGATGASNFDANHLSTATTFNVADVTGNANGDLIVSAPLRDQSGNYGLAAGGLVKTGAGRMDLTGVNTFTGGATVTGGTLLVGGTGSLNSSSGITVNGAGAKFVQTSSTPVFPVVTLTSGTVDGTGSLSTVNVAGGNGAVIANGNGGTGALAIDSLTFGGSAKLSLSLSSTSPVLNTIALTTGGGVITIDATNSAWTSGQVYNLLSYSALSGTLADFAKGTIANLGARQNATLTNPIGFISLSITGDVPLWTGLQSSNWTTATLASPKNWKLQSAGTTTDFLPNDTVIFDDTATNTAVNIAENVNPISTTFNNSLKSYTVGSTGGFGITAGSLIKNGSGTVTLGGKNTYAGVTSVNAGTLNITGSLGNTAVSVASGATLGLNAANAITQNTVTVDGTLTESVNNGLAGTAALVLNNGGTLANANAHSGGTTLTAGTLNLNHANALGTGVFNIAGGTLANTSGAPVTLANNPQVWTGAGFTFAGTNALNLGTGAVSLGTDASTGAVTVTNLSALPGASLTIGGTVGAGSGGAPGLKTLNVEGTGNTAFTGNITSGSAIGLILNDNSAGTLTLSGASSITTLNMNGGASSIVDLGAGTLTVSNGGLNVLQSTTGGTINATGGGSLVIGSANGDVGTATGTTLTFNAKLTGTNAVDFYGANGNGGTIVFAAANTSTGAIGVENSRLVIPATGAINAGNVANSGQVTVGTLNGLSGTLELNGGTINATKTAAPSLVVGNANGAVGALKMTAGTLNTTSELWVGSAAGSYGAFSMSGGTASVGSWLPVGRNGSGIMNVSGGTLNVTTQNFTTGSFTGTNGTLPGAFGVVNLTGGAVNVTSTTAAQGGFIVGEAGLANLNVSGTATLTTGVRGLQFAVAATGVGIANLNGGTVTTPLVSKGAGTGTLNFNGGTLKASAASTTFMTGLSSAYVNSGGAVIDDGGFAITVAQPLLAPTGSGVSAISVSSGFGFTGAPLVQITGDGTGATAVANIDADGNLTGITVTNPGVGYTTASANLIGGGSTGIVDSVSLAANTSGGFTKRGLGTLTLSGANSYTGATVVETGVLALTGSISGSTSIAAKAGATLNVSGVTSGFSLASGQALKGSGSVVGNVATSTGSIVSPGDTIGTLNLSGNLDITLAVTPSASSALVFELAGPGASDKVAFTTGALTIGTGVLAFDDFAFTQQAGLSNGTYTLFDGNSAIQGTLSSSGLSGSLGGGFTGTLGLADNGNDLVLTVVPEPTSAALLLAGVAGIMGFRRPRRAARKA